MKPLAVARNRPSSALRAALRAALRSALLLGTTFGAALTQPACSSSESADSVLTATAAGAGGFFSASVSATSGAGGEGGEGAPTNATPENLRVFARELLGRWTNTVATPLAPLRITGTDLGVSFERDGALTFLFGDSWTLDKPRTNQDSTARAALAFPTDGSLPLLDWAKLANGSFQALTVPMVNLAAMNVPVEGLVVDGRTFVFFSTGYAVATKRHTHSVLAHSDAGTLGALTFDHSVKTDRFINVSVVREGDTLYIYGSGPYRKSAIYLAKVKATELATRAAWTYYKGGPFVANEAAATPIIDAACVGELSARKHPGLGMVLVTYNCDEPRGVWLHAAAGPVGPFAEGVKLVDPGLLGGVGYGHSIHASEKVVAYDDGLSEKGRENEWGGEYGPYLVPSWSGPAKDGAQDLVFLMSTWNPYQVSLVRAYVGAEGTPFSLAAKGAGRPKAELVNGAFAAGNFSGWQSSGDAFALVKKGDGDWSVTSHVLPKGVKTVGKLWQDFTVDAATGELRFWVRGGQASVRLLRGDEVIRETRGRNTNATETLVRWHLETLRGQTLRVQIEDDLTDTWGFIAARGFELL